MSTEASEPTANRPERGLPPVAPPSGKFIVQLFVVPGLIVLCVVLLLLAGHWLVSGDNAPDRLLSDLQNPNPDVRWPAAEKLSQILKRDDEMASDPELGRKLASLLRRRWHELRAGHQTFTKNRTSQPEDEQYRELRKLQAQRKDVQYLMACLGTCLTPVGAPLLAELAKNDDALEYETRVLLRRQAVWALSLLGKNLERYATLKPELQAKALDKAKLCTEQTELSAEEQAWCNLTHRYLQAKAENKPIPKLGVIETLAECAQVQRQKGENENDLFLRKLVVQALRIWHGNDEEEQLLEQALVELARDDGFGIDVEIKDELPVTK